MKVLFIAARPPWPLDTGAKIRAYHVLEGMAKQHDVTLLTLYGNRQDEAGFSKLSRLGIQTEAVFCPGIDVPISKAVFAVNFFSSLPVTVQKYQDAEYLKIFMQLVAKGFDVVHCEHLHMAPYVLNAPIQIKGLDAHNIESQIALRMCQKEVNPVHKAALWVHYRKMFFFEKKIVRRMNYVFAVSDLDRLGLEAMGGRTNKIITVENGVDTDYFAPSDTPVDKSLVFVGSMDWEPNIDAVRYFVREIFPLIKEKISDIRFIVVGRRPPKDIEQMAVFDPAITVTGTVDDVRPYVREAGVVVIPIRFGGGTRLKVLEAFAMGKTVISTSLGSEGIAYRPGENILIADTPAAFATAVISAMGDESLRRRLGFNAESLAKSQYSWPVIQDKIKFPPLD